MVELGGWFSRWAAIAAVGRTRCHTRGRVAELDLAGHQVGGDRRCARLPAYSWSSSAVGVDRRRGQARWHTPGRGLLLVELDLGGWSSTETGARPSENSSSSSDRVLVTAAAHPIRHPAATASARRLDDTQEMPVDE
jgi:hypothetical protein